MFRLPVLFVVALIAAALLVACSSSATELSEEDAGRTVELRAGDSLEVTLVGNPTTGYMWEVGSVDAAVLTQVGEPEFKADSDLIGSPGTITLRFEAVAPGQTDLQLIYHRPWEEGVAPLETFEAMIVVK
jgi:inhibitor of cysteine peptidase